MGLEAPKLLVLVFLGCLTYIALWTHFSAKLKGELLCGDSSCASIRHRLLTLQVPTVEPDSKDRAKNEADRVDIELDDSIEHEEIAENTGSMDFTVNIESIEHATLTKTAIPTEPISSLKPTEPTDSKNIYCYYEKVYSGVDTMMKIWLRAWHMQGFHPHILSSQHAKLHPQYEYYMEAFAKHPTVNKKQYEMSCYRRWLAFSAVGGGTFSDYDIMPFGPVSFPEIHNDTLQSYREYAPMFTHAGSAGMERQLAFMANYSGRIDITKDGRKHLSDMIIMRFNMGFYDSLLKEPPLIHFSNRETTDFCTFDAKCGKRERFAADTGLLSRLTARRVVVLVPQGVGIVGNPMLYGFGLTEERVSQLTAYLVQCSCRGYISPYLPTSYADTKVQFMHTFPSDFSPGEHLVFFAYDREMKNEYDPQTLKRLVELYNTPDVIPLKTSDSRACQMVIGYNLGWYCEENNVIRFTNEKGSATPWVEYEMFNGRFSKLFDSYAELDKQLQTMQ